MPIVEFLSSNSVYATPLIHSFLLPIESNSLESCSRTLYFSYFRSQRLKFHIRSGSLHAFRLLQFPRLLSHSLFLEWIRGNSKTLEAGLATKEFRYLFEIYLKAYSISPSEIFTRNGLFLEYFPELFNNIEILRISLKNNGMALKFSKFAQSNLELVEIAVEQTGLAIQFVSSKLIEENPFLIELALSTSGISISSLPEIYRRKEKYLRLAMENDPRALDFSSQKFQNLVEFQELALSRGHIPRNISPVHLNNFPLLIQFANLNLIHSQSDRLIINMRLISLLNQCPREILSDPKFINPLLQYNGLLLKFGDSETIQNNFDSVKLAIEQDR